MFVFFFLLPTDHTPDRNTWKWGQQSSTPEYLERRHQYRRSEMRYRSKKARKNSSPNSSFDLGISSKNIQSTIDDNYFSSSLRTPSTESLLLNTTKVCNHNGENCSCHQVKTELNATLNRNKKMSEGELIDIPQRKTKSTRSKSEPRISDRFQKSNTLQPRTTTNTTNHSQLSDEEDSHSLKSNGSPIIGGGVEVKMYNTKTLPKRIATLKKNRAKSIKETSKFYMDLSDDTNILRITESTDNISQASSSSSEKKKKNRDTVVEVKQPKINVDDSSAVSQTEIPPKKENLEIITQTETDVGEEKRDDNIVNSDCINKKDSEIISELLKGHKEFDRILKKPPKKRSFDNGSVSNFELVKSRRSSEDSVDYHHAIEREVDPCSQTTIKQDTEQHEPIKQQQQQDNNLLSRLNDIQKEIASPEPIYESLLRNVHVPYKYSPVLPRSISHSFSQNSSSNNSPPLKPRMAKPIRPDSDYVTLDFSAIISESAQLSNSDSNINYNKITLSQSNAEEGGASPKPEDFKRASSFSVKQSKNVLQRFISMKGGEESGNNSIENLFIPRSKKNSDNLSLCIKMGKLPERRVSDVTEMFRKVTYKQGSENMGSRIAHIDYADPKTLFNHSSPTSLVSSQNILINKNSVKPQRDSVFSSSSDSVCDTKVISNNSTQQIFKNLENSDSFYEDKVEECLESDGFFRDSAIYSDDNNERKFENGFVFPTKFIESTSTPTKSPINRPPPKIPRKPIKSPPPPLPPKPILFECPSVDHVSTTSTPVPTQTSGGETTTSTTKERQRSWVSKQIQNFDK